MSQSTSEQRVNWHAFECNESQLKRVTFGPDEILVAPPTAEAWKALASVLAHHGYRIRPADTSSYCCRKITGGSEPSLHAYGIALDVNANTNPYRKTPAKPRVRFSDKATQEERERDVKLGLADTDMLPAMIADVRAIKTKGGVGVFEWGGDWQSIKDPMHFELDVTPAELATGIDWTSVVGANGVEPASVMGPSAPAQPAVAPVSTFAGELGVFEKCYPVVEKWEGNFDNDPDDPGGPTNMGITQADLARWRQHPVSVDDVRNLTRDEARQIFRAFYWVPIKGDQLPLPAAQMCYDSAVLTGIGRAARDMQEALNRQNANIAVDGIIGPNTISACLRANMKQFVSDFADIAETYLRGRPGFAKYGKGWLNRLNDAHAVAAAMAGAAPAATSATGTASPVSGGIQMPGQPVDIAALLQQLMNISRVLQPQTSAAATTAPATPQADDLKKIADLINMFLAAGKDGAPIGQVNGALGETLGNLLNGKKTAIGIIGAVLTSVLGAVPAGSGLGQVLGLLTPAAGLSPFTMPIFLAMTAWGVLGKLEKWSPGAAATSQLPPPPMP